ncbi:MAG: tetratricopeptide repeat protein [Nitrospirae bacterium]|nr:MAG: tetratricopeptide repeat protein [Nitrospirota bacterium]
MGKPFFHTLLIIVVGFLVYSNTFHVPFQFDDIGNIVGNYKLRDLSNFWPLSESRWFGYLTFALNYHFGGLNTIGYHIVNLIIHILNAILVYLLVVLTFKTPYFSTSYPPSPPYRKGGMGGFALFSALLFVSHPIQTQAVTYIVQRFTSLASMFYLLSLVMYIKFRLTLTLPPRGGGMGGGAAATRYTLYAVSFLSAILAMKTKEIAFTLPFIITLYEFMFFEGKIKKRIIYLLPLLLTMLIIPLSLVGTDKPIGDAIGELREVSQEGEEIPRWSYLSTQFRVIVTYLRLLFVPINQNLDYDYPIYHSFFNPEVFLSFLFLLTIFSFAVYLLYAKRYTLSVSRFLSFGIFWLFITLSVESSIIPIRDVIFEHRLYLPVIGIIIVFVSATFYILQAMIQSPRRSLAACYLLLVAAVIVLSIVAYQRNTVWHDAITLWEDVVKKSPNKARGHDNIGNVYADKGWPNRAIQHYQIALMLGPTAETHSNLGTVYADLGYLDDAIRECEIAIRLKPNFAELHYNLGNVYDVKGLTDKAIGHYQIAIRLKPDFAKAYNNLGNIYADNGLTDKAIEHYQIAIRLKPDFAEAYNNLGNVYDVKGLIDKAIEHYQIAIRLKPDYEKAHHNLRLVLTLNPEAEVTKDSLNRIPQIRRNK